jgi:hypothetical protein
MTRRRQGRGATPERTGPVAVSEDSEGVSEDGRLAG